MVDPRPPVLTRESRIQMIDANHFENPAEAQLVLDRIGSLASALTGRPSRIRLLPELDGSTEKRILELKDDAFDKDSGVFDQRALAEIAADPEALFLVLEVDGEIEGCCFGYYEEPGEETVSGTDFFIDTALVSSRWQGQGIAAATGAGVMILIHLLNDVHRPGIAVWDGARTDELVEFYRKFGFVDAESQRSPYRCMAVDLHDERVGEWRTAIGLAARPSQV